MKKISIVFFCISLFFTSCLSMTTQKKNIKVETPFSGTMDTLYGYEAIKWGTDVDDINKIDGYSLCAEKENGVVHYYYGITKEADGYRWNEKYGHGDIESTEFTFYNNKLYSVKDVLSIKEPSFAYLHERYGDFSEENIAEKNDLLRAVYSNSYSFSCDYIYSLFIVILKDGTTVVLVMDPYANYSIENSSFSKRFLNDTNAGPKNVWHLLGYTNVDNQSFELIIRNENDDGNAIIIYYSKKIGAPVQSSVRIGFDFRTWEGGDVEIKTDERTVRSYFWPGQHEVRFSPLGYNFNFERPSYNGATNPPTINTRDLYNIITSNSSIDVRFKGKVTTFKLPDLEKSLVGWGLSLDEIDFAIGNEEL